MSTLIKEIQYVIQLCSINDIFNHKKMKISNCEKNADSIKACYISGHAKASPSLCPKYSRKSAMVVVSWFISSWITSCMLIPIALLINW